MRQPCPEFEVVGHLFFVIPLKLRAKFFGMAIAVIGAACWAANIQPMIGPASVLFGSAFGWAYVRQLGFGNPFWWQRRLYERRQRTQRLARMNADQFVAEEGRSDPGEDRETGHRESHTRRTPAPLSRQHESRGEEVDGRHGAPVSCCCRPAAPAGVTAPSAGRIHHPKATPGGALGLQQDSKELSVRR
jgi:hypothetical protein